MTRLLIAASILLTSAILWLNRQGTLQHRRYEVRALGEQLEEVRHSLATEEGKIEALKDSMAESREARDRARDAVRSRAVEPAITGAPEGVAEGRFPEGQPYWYVSKKHLANFEVELFEKDLLTEEATVVFGMTDAERIAINEALAELWDAVIRVESGRIEQFEPPKPLPASTHQVMLARMPDLTRELASIVDSFDESVRRALGAQRAELFLGHARTAFAVELPGYWVSSRMYVVSRWPDGSETLEVHFQEGDTTWTAEKNWTLPEAFGRLPFRHLFRGRVPEAHGH